MPIFMDLHIVPGIEAKHAAEAHQLDLKVQHKYGCRCMTYWVDESRGNAFCLIDAPDEASVRAMHRDAHGLIPGQIIRVNGNVVEAFLGRIHHPEGYANPDDPSLKIFNDPAFRIIMVTDIEDRALLTYSHGPAKAEQLLTLYYDIVRESLIVHEGREIESEDDGLIISFVSVAQSIACAHDIQKLLHIGGDIIKIRLGIHAGIPVDDSKEIFGNTIRSARRLCSSAKINQLVVSATVKKLYKQDSNLSFRKDHMRMLDQAQQDFVEAIFDVLEEAWSDTLGIPELMEKLAMSKSGLYRSCRKSIGNSPNNLIREYRLNKSLNLLRSGKNITETAFEAGFSSPSYFSKCFQRQFGIQPLEFLKLLN